MNREPTGNAITEGVIWKQLLLFFFPIMLGMLFQQMYNIVDTVVVGQFVGTQALAAVGASAPLTRLLIGFFMGISSGATVVLSLHYGAKNGQGIHDAIHTGMAVAVAGGLLATVGGIAVTPAVLRLIDTPESCLADCILYTCIFFAGSIPSLIYNMGSGLLRAMGDSRRPMIFLIIGCVINIVLDLFFVVVLQWGVAGAAIATVTSQCISAVMVIWVLMRLPGESRLNWSEVRFKKTLLVSILRIGLPAGMQCVMFDVSNLIIQAGINNFGDVTVAAWTAIGKADAIIWLICSAFGMAITTFVGQNFGARKYDRVRQSVRACMVMCLLTMGLLSGLLAVFRYPVLSIFTPDAAVIETGTYIILSTSALCFLYGPVEIFSGAMRGTGYSLVPTVIIGVCACFFRVIWIAFVSNRLQTLLSLCLAYPITWTMATVVFTVVYLHGGWLKKRIAASDAALESA